RDDAIAPHAFGDNLAVERCEQEAPFGSRIGMGEAAAERAAIADRVMGDVLDHIGQELAERALANLLVKRRVAHAGADDELAAGDGNAIERLDAIDVDKMGRLGEPECHGRHQALAAGQDAPVLARDFGEQLHRIIDRLRRVIAKCSRLHNRHRCTVAGRESKQTTGGRTTEDVNDVNNVAAVVLSVICPPSPVIRMLRFDDIGNRLKAFRLGSGLSAEEIAAKLGISRTALYRFEKGELAKIETLEKLAELLKVSVPTLLRVGVEYIASAVSYFERMRQIEETAEHIIVLAGPISYVLASDGFDRALDEVLRESVPDAVAKNSKALAQIDELMAVLRSRKEAYRRRRPAIVNLIAASEMQRFLRNGLVGRLDLPEAMRRERRRLARAEAEHFTALMAEEPIGVQIGIVLDTLPHTSFQIFRQPDRRILALSPFRLGEEPNI